jgi:adenosine deaminase
MSTGVQSAASRENVVVVSEVNFAELSLLEIEKTSKYLELLARLKKSFKTDLHAHLGGALSKEFIKKHSTAQEYAELIGFIDKLKSGIDYSDAFKAFSMIGRVLNSNQRIEEAAFDFCQNQHNDNVTFTELRTGLKRLDGGFEDYLKAVIAGLERGMEAYPIRVTLVLSLRRETSFEDADETIALAIKYRGQIVKGIDVSGESIKGDGKGIFEALRQARSKGLPITLHIGESKDESPEQQLKELKEIQPSRVGHAVHLCPEAQEWIENNQIVVEACLRSALSVMIKKPTEHPALALFKKGHPVVFCTDDSTLFGSHSEELALDACLCDLTIEQVTEMQKAALTYAFN